VSRSSQPIRWDIGSAGILPDVFDPREENRRPLVPRAIFGVLNTLLYFPSGVIYPVEGFPVWLRWISYVEPFTYAVHALKALLLKNTGFSGIYSDILILSGFSVVLVSLSVAFFKRQI
jgi:ABC-2 type transport system permease protein